MLSWSAEFSPHISLLALPFKFEYVRLAEVDAVASDKVMLLEEFDD